MKKGYSLCVVFYLCFLFTGCEKGEEIVYYTDDLLTKNGIDDVEFFFESKSYDGKTIWYYGLRKGKEWFALFDKSANSLVTEWYGKEQSAEDFDMSFVTPSDYYPNPAELGNNEYLLWYSPCAGHINTNTKQQLIHLQADGTVKYGKILTEDDKDRPYFYLKGKGWFAIGNGGDICAYDSYFENVIIKDIKISKWDSLQIFTGFYNDRLWLGLANDQSILIDEYLTEEFFERKRKVHLGYGEYEEYMIKTVSMGDCLSTKWGYAFLPSYFTTTNEHIGQDVFLLNDGKIIFCKLEDKYTGVSLRTWYKESILVNNKYVVSPQGEKLCEGDFFRLHYDYNIPTSYSSWLNINEYGVYMYRLGADCIWYTLFKKPIENNAKTNYTLLLQEEDVWTFRCDIVSYDGSKEQMKFKINIETGELIYL